MTFSSQSTAGGGSSPPAKNAASGTDDGNPIKTPKSPSVLKCDRILASLQDCVKKHPTQQNTVCAHLHRAAGWCLIREACPVQGTKINSKLEISPDLLPSNNKLGMHVLFQQSE
jgi:hypothetical protein